MLNRLLDLLEKDPKKVAIMGLLASLPLIAIAGIADILVQQQQAQRTTQTQVSEVLEYTEEETFDRSQCKVYYAGALIGADVFWFRYASGGMHLMFTDSDQLVDRHQNRGINIWLTKSDFLNLIGNDLMPQMEPEVREVFARRLDGANYVAVLGDNLTTRAIGAADNCVR